MTSTLNEKRPDRNAPGSYQLLDKDFASAGIQVSYLGGSRCTSLEDYTLTIEVNCADMVEDTPLYTVQIESLENPCNPRIIMSSAHGCPRIETNSLTELILDFYFLMCLPMVVAGVLLLVFGGRHPTTALAVITTALIGTIWLYTIYYLLPSYSPNWSVWLIMYFAYGNGFVLGLGSTMNPRLGVTVCGAAFGLFVGLIIDLTIIKRFVDTDSLATTWVIVGLMIVFGLLSIPMYDYAVIISSSIFGAYMLWRVS